MEINQREIARRISKETGFSITDIEKVFNLQSAIFADELAKGNSIKMLKAYRLKPSLHKGSSKVYDGIHKRYYTLDAHYKLKFVPLSQLKKAQDRLNS